MKGLSPGGTKIVILGTVFYFLALVAVVLRIWAGRIKGRKLAASDWLSILSLFILTVLTALLFAGAFIGGAGYHQHQLGANLSMEGGDTSMEQAAKIVFIAEMLWLGTNTITKLSTLALYLGIFEQDRRFRQCVYFFATPLVIVSYVAFVLKDFLLCRPISRNWTFESGQFCGITTSGTLATGIVVTVTDAIVVLLPLPIVLRLQMRPARRWAVGGVFSLGLLVCIVSGLRLDSVTRIQYDDITYTIVPLGVYTLLEPQLGLFVSTLPTLRPVFARLFESRTYDQHRYHKASGGHSRSSSSRGSYGAIGSLGHKVSRPGSVSSLGERSTGMWQHSASGSLYDPGQGGAGESHTETETRHFRRLYDHLYPLSPNDDSAGGAVSFSAITEVASPESTSSSKLSTVHQQEKGMNTIVLESTCELDLEAGDLGHYRAGTLVAQTRDDEKSHGQSYGDEIEEMRESHSQLGPFILPPPIPPRSPLRVPTPPVILTPPLIENGRTLLL